MKNLNVCYDSSQSEPDILKEGMESTKEKNE